MTIDWTLSTVYTVKTTGTTQAINYESQSLSGLAVSESLSQTYSVANGATDVAVGLGPIASASLIIIISDQALTFKFNGSSVGIAARFIAVEGGAITSLTVSNASGSAASLKVYATGA